MFANDTNFGFCLSIWDRLSGLYTHSPAKGHLGVEIGLSPWDIAAGALLVEEAGGTVTDLDGGGNFLSSGSVLAAGAGVHAALRSRLLELDMTEQRLVELLSSSAE